MFLTEVHADVDGGVVGPQELFWAPELLLSQELVENLWRDDQLWSLVQRRPRRSLTGC